MEMLAQEAIIRHQNAYNNQVDSLVLRDAGTTIGELEERNISMSLPALQLCR